MDVKQLIEELKKHAEGLPVVVSENSADGWFEDVETVQDGIDPFTEEPVLVLYFRAQ